MSATTYGNGGTATITRQEAQFAGQSTDAVVNEFEARWQLAKNLVENLFESAPNMIDSKSAYPIVPQTVIGIVTNLFGFTPRTGLVDSELHAKVEALSGKSSWETTGR